MLVFIVFTILMLAKRKKFRIDIFIYFSYKKLEIDLFNRDLNRGCLVYMFSLSFSGSLFLINLRR